MRTNQVPALPATLPAQTVVVVDGTADVVGMIENVLDAGRYDMVFVNAEDGYSQVKKVLPNLVILCTRIEAMDGFQLLTMLKLDADTRDIPVLTYTTEYEGQQIETQATPADDDPTTLPATTAAIRMN